MTPPLHAHRPHPRYALPAAAATVLALALPAPAGAQDVIPPNNGGATQYIPPRPDPGGDKPSSPGGPGSQSRPDRLPASTRAALPSGGEGQLLERFATSTAYGAPADEPRGGGKGDGSGGSNGGKGEADGSAGRRAHAAEDGGSVASAVTSAASDGGAAVLAVGLAALTLGAIAAARSRRRRPGD